MACKLNAKTSSTNSTNSADTANGSGASLYYNALRTASWEYGEAQRATSTSSNSTLDV